MFYPRANKLISIITIIVAVLLLASCSSSKSVIGCDDNKIYKNEKVKKASDKDLVKEAKKWIGTKYKYGGHSLKGTDCSGLVMEIFLNVYNLKLPRSSSEQYNYCKKIKKSQLDVGDLVFFATGKSKKRVSHVGLYIGNDQFIHASTSKGVIISRLTQEYYKRTYYSSGRVKK